MAKTEQEYRQDIVDIGRLVYQKGWVAANDGNITLRLDAQRILATPTGVSKGMMHVDDLIIVDMKGNKISGRAERNRTAPPAAAANVSAAPSYATLPPLRMIM